MKLLVFITFALLFCFAKSQVTPTEEDALALILRELSDIQDKLEMLETAQVFMMERQSNFSFNFTIPWDNSTIGDLLNNPDAIFNDSAPAAPPPFNVSSIGEFLDVGLAPASPFVFYDSSKQGNAQFSGFSIDYLEKLVSLMATDGYVIKTKYQYFASIGSSLDAEYLKTVDCAMSAIAITSRREQKFTFTAAYYDSGLQILAPQVSGQNLDLLFLPFTWQLWVFILALSIILGSIIWIFERTTEGESDLASSYLAGCFDGAYFVGAKFMGGGDFGMKRAASKLIYISLCFMSVIFVASYTANLAAILTVANLQFSINGVSDLPGKQVGYVKSKSSTDTSTVEDFFNNNAIYPLLIPYDNEEAMFADAEAGNLDAVICELPTAQYYLTKTNPNSILGFAGGTFTTDGFAIALKQGVQPSLLAILNYYIIYMKEKGYQNDIYTKWFGVSTISTPPPISSLDIQSMETLYITMAVITGIALVFYILHKLTGIEHIKLLWGQTDEDAKNNWYNKTLFPKNEVYPQ